MDHPLESKPGRRTHGESLNISINPRVDSGVILHFFIIVFVKQAGHRYTFHGQSAERGKPTPETTGSKYVTIINYGEWVQDRAIKRNQARFHLSLALGSASRPSDKLFESGKRDPSSEMSCLLTAPRGSTLAARIREYICTGLSRCVNSLVSARPLTTAFDLSLSHFAHKPRIQLPGRGPQYRWSGSHGYAVT